MKNTEYIIYISTKPGSTWTYRREKDSWTQTTPKGKVRKLTAEQLLSHILPPLGKDQPGIIVKVERIESEVKE
jgi:hypothetical protein